MNMTRESTRNPKVLVRTLSLLVVSVGIGIALGPAASGNTQSRSDPNDTVSRLDINLIRHGHARRGNAFKHVVATREGWSIDGFRRKGSIFYVFSWQGTNCADARVVVDVRDQKLRARWQPYDPLGCGRGDDFGVNSEFERSIPIRRSGNDRVVLLVPRSMFPKRIDNYRWGVTTLWRCSNPCGDSAPDRENGDRATFLHRV